MHHGAIREHGHVLTLAHRRGLAQRNCIVARGDVARRMLRPGLERPVMMSVERSRVETLRFEEQHRVLVLDGADEQALGVIRIGRDHRLEAAHMGKEPLRALAVRLPAEDAAAIGRAHGDRRMEIARRTVAQSCCHGNELIESRVDVVSELALDHGFEPIGAHADRHRDLTALGNGRVEHARFAMALLQPIGDAEYTAEEANVLAEDQHIRITLQHHVERGVERLDHVHRRHDLLRSRSDLRRFISSRCSARCQGISL